jgi:DNA-binding HxlR family transcriptional regulator
LQSTTDIPGNANPLATALDLVGDRWTLLIVDALLTGPRRFGELGESVEGIAPNILSTRLKQLERDAIVVSRPYSRRPLRMSYELSGAGRELAGALRLLAHWAAGHTDDHAPRHPQCGSAMEARWYCPTCARVVDERETEALDFI